MKEVSHVETFVFHYVVAGWRDGLPLSMPVYDYVRVVNIIRIFTHKRVSCYKYTC